MVSFSEPRNSSKVDRWNFSRACAAVSAMQTTDCRAIGYRARIAARLARMRRDLGPSCRDPVGTELGGQPSLAPLSGAPYGALAVAAGEDRQRRLHGLGKRLDVDEPPVFAVVAGPCLFEQDAQRFDALYHQVVSVRRGQIRHHAFEFVAVAAARDGQVDPPTADVVQGGHLFSQQHRVAHRQHQDPGAQSHHRRLGGDGGQHHQRFEVVGGDLPCVADEPLRAQVVIARHFVVTELLGLDGDPDHIAGTGEGHRVGHPGQAGWDIDSELHTLHDDRSATPSESVR